MQKAAKVVETILLERDPHFVGLLLHFRENKPVGLLRSRFLALLLQNAVSRPRHARVQHEKPVLQTSLRGRLHDDRIHKDGTVRVELDVFEATVCRSILILLPDWLTANL